MEITELEEELYERKIDVSIGDGPLTTCSEEFLGDDKLPSVRLGEGKASAIGEDVGIG